MLIPRKPVPGLSVDTLANGRFDLASEASAQFTLVSFYRGLHCPICVKSLSELGRLLAEFEQRGVTVIALSTDDRERTEAMARKVNAPPLRFGYGLGLGTAREWGLYLSTGRGKTSAGVEEPAIFAEPGVFLIRPDRTLYYGAVQTMPFARPHFDELLAAVDYAITKDYPARGEYVGDV
jgi:peroxiredoxin